ncbi:MAG: prepilin-type N-terminal cleavage/methylation domain-containing protein [Caldisericia bacterium]|nr:prepilin-type N-terminal cleavage/methylation domain-containing protein [Caldisericia bacterium]
MTIFKIFKQKKGLTLIEVMIALVIFIFPIFATLSTVTFLYRQTNSRHLELLAENLSNYILEDLRGRKFYYQIRDSNGNIIYNDPNATFKNNLQRLYEGLPKNRPVPNPFYQGSTLLMRYEENLSINENNLYFDFEFRTSDNNIINIKNFYRAFSFDLYITRYPMDILRIDDIYETIYKIDLVIKWKEGTRDRLLKSSTEVSYHEP